MHADVNDLGAVAQVYLAALGTNDAASLAVTADVRFTENGQLLELGKGLWGTATPEPPPRIVGLVADADAGEVGVLAVVGENRREVLLALRLALRDGQIAEIETLVGRDRQGIFSLEGLADPRPAYTEVLEPSERTSRAVLESIPHRYLDGILAGDGDMIPVRADCVRVENGVQTVLNPTGEGIREERRDDPAWALGVAEQVSAGKFHDIEGTRERRVVAVDEERGLVFAIFFFDHAGPLVARGGVSRFPEPNSMLVAEVFKVRRGTIERIEAFLGVFPYGMRSGW